MRIALVVFAVMAAGCAHSSGVVVKAGPCSQEDADYAAWQTTWRANAASNCHAADQARQFAEETRQRQHAPPPAPIAPVAYSPQTASLSPEAQANIRAFNKSHENAEAVEAATPRERSVALSARICSLIEERAETKTKVTKLRHYGEETGVVSKAKLYRCQQELRATDAQLDYVKGGMKTAHLPVLSCSEPNVRQVAQCIAAKWGECPGKAAASRPVVEAVDEEMSQRDVGSYSVGMDESSEDACD